MQRILGNDISAWQGKITQKIVNNFVSLGRKFVVIKASQGTGYKNPYFEESVKLFQAAGIKVAPYHFVTVDKPKDQYNWFAECTKGLQFDILPWLDCEGYDAIKLYTYWEKKFSGADYDEPDIEANGNLRDCFYPEPREHYGLVFVDESIVANMVSLISAKWLPLQTKLSKFQYPAIYTNKASGDRIFKTTQLSVCPLVVANWYNNWESATPVLPDIWRVAKKPYYIWQYNVVDAWQYGVASAKIDCDVWGSLIEFPESEPEVDTKKRKINIVITTEDGSKYSGDAVLERI